jgi:hypothetical protein
VALAAGVLGSSPSAGSGNLNGLLRHSGERCARGSLPARRAGSMRATR